MILNTSTDFVPRNIVNLHGEHPTIIFGPKSLDKFDDRSYFPPPFYITLTVLERMLHNFLLDSRDSHNLIPKVVMESLGLIITKPYHDLYAFDSRSIKCLGVIKDIVINLT